MECQGTQAYKIIIIDILSRVEYSSPYIIDKRKAFPDCLAPSPCPLVLHSMEMGRFSYEDTSFYCQTAYETQDIIQTCVL